MKTLVKTLLLVCLAIQVHAQNDDDKPAKITDWKFAGLAALNFSTVSGDIGDNESGLLDFSIGSVINVPTNLNFNIQIEPQFSRVGSRREGETLRRYTFLDIPVMMQVFKQNKVSIEFGPKVAITLDQKQLVSGELTKVDRLKPITLGMAAGTTYNFDSNWFGQFRLNIWGSDIIRKDGGDTEGTSVLLFQFGVGYWFN